MEQNKVLKEDLITKLSYFGAFAFISYLMFVQGNKILTTVFLLVAGYFAIELAFLFFAQTSNKRRKNKA